MWRTHLEGCAKDKYLPPVTVDIDPSNRCNYDCIWCLPPDTPVLKDNWQYSPIQDIKVGDTLIGFDDENIRPRLKQLGLSKTIVKTIMSRPVNKLISLTTSIGSITCTPEHRIWESRGRWKQAQNFNIGDKILSFGYLPTLNQSDEHKIGWLSGVADGDGCFWTITKSNRRQFRLALIDKDILNTFKLWAKLLGNFNFYDGVCKAKRCGEFIIPAIYLTQDKEVLRFEQWLKKLDTEQYQLGWLGGIFDAEGSITKEGTFRISQKKKHIKHRITQYLTNTLFNYKIEENGIRLIGGKSAILTFANSCKPILIRKFDKLLNTSTKNKVVITNIEEINKSTIVYDIETSTHNFIACGVKVHNCNANDIIHQDTEEKEMTEGHLINLSDFIASWRDKDGNGPKSACIAGGGEPLMNKNIASLLERMLKNNLESGLITNGSLLNDELIKIIAHTCRWVGFSMDASKSETYNKIKGISGDLFFKVQENIRKLNKYIQENSLQCETTYKFLIHPNNISEIYDATAIAKDLGCSCIHARPVGWLNLSKIKDKEPLTYNTQEISTHIERALSLEDEHFKVYGISHKFTQEKVEPKKNFSRCWAIPILPTFSADGWVYTCFDMRGRKDLRLCRHYPNLEEVAKFWGSEKHVQIIRSIDIKKCPRCTFTIYNELIEKVIIDDKMCRYFP
jgi:MoaA/NifB/PqqE/SkfB family radical SAM enzyme